ncbi:hypothetical protein HGM15179_014751 [Zosterops borbonicus]|uniref:formyltetrahydrofolate dehydrogenase n=1 Tax=Zosterops borbonicus TaxID=364589 RepID=A0A8K1LFX1_9PASS|nr:hypothetical protein HGM15179_014751 [Zosterops borbonicus]
MQALARRQRLRRGLHQTRRSGAAAESSRCWPGGRKMLRTAPPLLRTICTSAAAYQHKLKLALIGQSIFGQEVYNKLRKEGHKVVGVFTVPDKNGQADPLALAAEKDGTPVFKFPKWRAKGKPIQEVVAAYKSVGAELNVLPFCTQFIPMDVIDCPKHGSIIYHPSILPRHRGASAINWTLIQGDKKAGFTIFWADDGLDTGPILLQRECEVGQNDTVDDLYNRFLFPEGIKAMVEAVHLIADGKAPRIPQPKEGATYEGIQKKENAEISWDQPAAALHNWIRGHDKVPGAWTTINGQVVTFYGSSLLDASVPAGQELTIKGASRPGLVTKNGLVIFGNDGKMVLVRNLQFEDGKMIPASKYFSADETTALELTEEEKKIAEDIRAIWKGILSNVAVIEDSTDFFKSGASSMHVVRMLEEIKQKHSGLQLQNEDVYMATKFADFIQMAVRKLRGEDKEEELVIDYVSKNMNKMTVNMPYQCFINGKFIDADDGKTYDTINPADGSVIASVSSASLADVDKAVAAAKEAFENGEWRRMNARERGRLMYRKNSSHHAPIQKRDLTSLNPDCDSEIIHWSRTKATALTVFLPWVSIAKSMGELGHLECWVAKQANLTTQAISDLLSDEQITRQATLQNRAAIDYLLSLNQHSCEEFEGLCCFNLSSKAENVKKSIQQLQGMVDSIKQETGDWFGNIFKGVGLSNIASSWVKTGLLVLFIILIVAIATGLVKNLIMNVIFPTTTPSVHSVVPAIEFPPDSASSSDCDSEIYTPEQ